MAANLQRIKTEGCARRSFSGLRVHGGRRKGGVRKWMRIRTKTLRRIAFDAWPEQGQPNLGIDISQGTYYVAIGQCVRPGGSGRGCLQVEWLSTLSFVGMDECVCERRVVRAGGGQLCPARIIRPGWTA